METKYQIIDESTLNRILDKHFKDGFIIITAYRAENSSSENKKNFEQLKQIVRSNKYSFIPVYGGFIENLGTSDEKEVREPSLLIPNHIVASTKAYENINDLKELGIKLCKKYNQDSFLFQPTNSNKSFYITKDGKIDMTFTGKNVNDLAQIYFTELSKSTAKHNKFNKTNKRFTYTENLYLLASPTGLSEAIKRYGEQFFNLKQ